MTLALLLTAVGGAWAQTETLLTTITPSGKDTYSETPAGVVTVTPSNMRRYNVDYGWLWSVSGSVTVEAKEGYTITKCVFKQNAKTPVTITTSPFAITFNERGHCEQNDDMDGVTSIEVYGPAAPAEPAIDVTINDTKTEASFDMPTYDVNVNYELVRDITQKVDVETRIDGAATERIRIAKDNDGHYKFVTKQGWQFAAVDKLDNNKDLTNGELTYTLKMKVGDEYVAKNFDTELCPGTWRLEATANAEKPYEGTAYGKDIELYQGYEVTVPAGEYATFYKDENLYTEDKDAVLYTIANVTDTEAQLSDAIKVAPAETPLLVYNKSEESKTFLLIPTTEQADEVTPATEFKGSLTEGEIPASSAVTDYYALNGKAFVWVKNAIEVGANKCWLQIGDQPAAARAMTRSIVGGGNTTNMDDVRWQMEDGNYYDLQGRKVEKPNRKGIYIHNGQKVIVR